MLSSKQFFEDLKEGQEYMSCLMTKEVYSGIDFELREQMYMTEIRQKNEALKEDETHKKLVGNILACEKCQRKAGESKLRRK